MSNDFGEFLTTLRFPIEKEEILLQADRHGLDGGLRDVLDRIPDREYDTVADVALETGALPRHK